MKFSTKEDLEIGIEPVFAMLTDFDVFERAGLRHGAEVTRSTPDTGGPVGTVWTVKARWRGKKRVVDITLQDFDQPHEMRYVATSGGMRAEFLVELVSLSRNRTRMRMELDVRPKTLSARLVMQSAKLARNTLNKRYKTRIAHFAEDLEDRHKRGLSKFS